MIKRALISALLSVGCDVLDMRSAPLPVARHFIKASGAAGAISVRKLPGNPRVTLIEMFDSRGAYLNKNLERKVENAFFREDFRRIDSEDLGVIEFVGRAVEEYQSEFFRLLNFKADLGQKLQVVCDYGFSSVSAFYPAMLVNLGIESISLNAYNDARKAPRTQDHIDNHVKNLSHIVGTLGYDMGVLFLQEGERMIVVDNRGRAFEGLDLLAAMGLLVSETTDHAKIAMTTNAPVLLEKALAGNGADVIRTKVDTRALMNSSMEQDVTFAGNFEGGFIFPVFHPGFDATFAFGKLIAMLYQTKHTLSDLADRLPEFRLATDQVRVPWDTKGAIMRLLAEESRSKGEVDMLDGIKIYRGSDWVLILPDSVEPIFHIFAESTDNSRGKTLVDEYVAKIKKWSTGDAKPIS